MNRKSHDPLDYLSDRSDSFNTKDQSTGGYFDEDLNTRSPSGSHSRQKKRRREEDELPNHALAKAKPSPDIQILILVVLAIAVMALALAVGYLYQQNRSLNQLILKTENNLGDSGSVLSERAQDLEKAINTSNSDLKKNIEDIQNQLNQAKESTQALQKSTQELQAQDESKEEELNSLKEHNSNQDSRISSLEISIKAQDHSLQAMKDFQKDEIKLRKEGQATMKKLSDKIKAQERLIKTLREDLETMRFQKP